VCQKAPFFQKSLNFLKFGLFLFPPVPFCVGHRFAFRFAGSFLIFAGSFLNFAGSFLDFAGSFLDSAGSFSANAWGIKP
jgi:hypothetical protein